MDLHGLLQELISFPFTATGVAVYKAIKCALKFGCGYNCSLLRSTAILVFVFSVCVYKLKLSP
jgi:hypothetical protein